ncbi:Zinc finger SWIM domain-containing protein [Trichinella pseudospiralis]
MWEKRQQEPTKTNYPNRLVSDPPVSKCRQRYVDRGPVASRRATVGIQDSGQKLSVEKGTPQLHQSCFAVLNVVTLPVFLENQTDENGRYFGRLSVPN